MMGERTKSGNLGDLVLWWRVSMYFTSKTKIMLVSLPPKWRLLVQTTLRDY